MKGLPNDGPFFVLRQYKEPNLNYGRFLACPPRKRELKVGDKIRVNLHHGLIEDAIVRAVIQDDTLGPISMEGDHFMPRVTVPPMGPYAKWVEGFLKISTAAFSLVEHLVPPELTDDDSLAHRTIFDLSVIAETTSICMRFAITHSLAVPAFALTRVRLEQCIISSFLVHAPRQEGMGPYHAHQPIQISEIMKKYQRRFGTDLNTLVTDQRAREALQQLNPQGEFKEGRFKRTWTPLELRELAKRRDALAMDTSPLPWRLEDEYWQWYPLTSLFVHGASEVVYEQGEFHAPELGSRERYPYTLPQRARRIMRAVAKLDLVQACETLSYLGSASLETIQPLVLSYQREAARDA